MSPLYSTPPISPSSPPTLKKCTAKEWEEYYGNPDAKYKENNPKWRLMSVVSLNGVATVIPGS